MTRLMWERAAGFEAPFPHWRIPEVIPLGEADTVLAWLTQQARWTLRVEDFYQQHEFSLLTTPLDVEVGWLASEAFITKVHTAICHNFKVTRELRLIDVSAHRLAPGQVIRIHNDYIENAETHRLLIQLNAGWNPTQGGLLMLFAEDDVRSVKHVISPAHGSGFAFEISPLSFHAVSEVKQGQRYTLVYTFG